MSGEITKISFGRKLIFLGAAHLTLNSTLLVIGKELFLEVVPAAKLLFLPEIADEIWKAILISFNTLPLTLGIAYIVYNWKSFTGYKLLSASIVLWICLFVGSWLHLGVDYDKLFPDKAIRLKDYVGQPGTNAFIQLLTYPVAVFFTVYGYVMFFTSVLVGYVAATSANRQEIKKAESAKLPDQKENRK